MGGGKGESESVSITSLLPNSPVGIEFVQDAETLLHCLVPLKGFDIASPREAS